ncbi:hypothetical protein AV656_13265 [Bhargavaea cecembensis]|uniref:DUF1572 domain-containing protein n=1 Tax=Bhargavaea cecembensis TaxID=394098 RepID=A0A165GSS2_9BACL|nr:DUF1572 family protein [Bhargavaea cecembensis]KZE37524.1 hypothetical protein AV656_13265 [Bhargavaea cecembensis]
MSIGKEYLKAVRGRFVQLKDLGDRSVAQLNDQEIHHVPGPESNSVAVIVRHLSGNMISRWTDFFTTDGEKPDRNRDGEFETVPVTKAELQEISEAGWKTLFGALESLNEDDLMRELYIRGERHTVIEAMERHLSHVASHIGQIVYIAKMLKGENWTTLSIPKGQSEAYRTKPTGQ